MKIFPILLALSWCQLWHVPFLSAQTKNTTKKGQGIYGKVEFLSGDFMPMVKQGKTEPANTRNSRSGVKRKLLLFSPPLMADSAKGVFLDGYFVTVRIRKPTYITSSNKEGEFKINTKPGLYSVVVVEPDGKLFCNGEDEAGNLCAVKVEANKWQKQEIKVNYKAVY